MNHTKQLIVPDPVINAKEANKLDVLKEQYEKLIEPSKINMALKKVGAVLPNEVNSFGRGVSYAISAQDIYKNSMGLISKGLKYLEENAAKVTVSENSIIDKINKVTTGSTISCIEEICFVRSYEISKAVSAYKTQDFFLALAEGGITGVAGFAGIPFNLALSTLIYFRAVQSVAMFYGYDIKNSAEEMVISTEVFTRALAPGQQDVNNELTATISKIMLMSQAATVKQTAKKTWTDMASRGGASLLIAQLRALANKSAQKALEKAGAKGLENSMFREAFEQIGKKLTLKKVRKAVPVVSAVFGALIDASQMRKVLDYADTFYHKRFILEKESRIISVVNSVNSLTQ